MIERTATFILAHTATGFDAIVVGAFAVWVASIVALASILGGNRP